MEPGTYLALANLTHRLVSEHQLAVEVRGIMRDLGKQEFRNAMIALADADMSSSPRHELTSAINHLQSAISNLQSAYASARRSFGQSLTAQDDPNFDPDHPRYPFGISISQAQAFIAAIYYRLGEQGLAQRYGEEFRRDLMKGYAKRYDVRDGFDKAWGGGVPASRLVAQFTSNVEANSKLQGAFRAIDEGGQFLRCIGVSADNFTVEIRTIYRCWSFHVANSKQLLSGYQEWLRVYGVK